MHDHDHDHDNDHDDDDDDDDDDDAMLVLVVVVVVVSSIFPSILGQIGERAYQERRVRESCRFCIRRFSQHGPD